MKNLDFSQKKNDRHLENIMNLNPQKKPNYQRRNRAMSKLEII